MHSLPIPYPTHPTLLPFTLPTHTSLPLNLTPTQIHAPLESMLISFMTLDIPFQLMDLTSHLALYIMFQLLPLPLPMMTPLHTTHTFYSSTNHSTLSPWRHTFYARDKCASTRSQSTTLHSFTFHLMNANTLITLFLHNTLTQHYIFHSNYMDVSPPTLNAANLPMPRSRMLLRIVFMFT